MVCISAVDSASKARQIDSSGSIRIGAGRIRGNASGVLLRRVTREKVGVGGQTGIAAILVINLHINRSSV